MHGRRRMLLLVSLLLATLLPGRAFAQTPAASPTSDVKTEVTFFAPYSAQGLNPDVKVSKTISGSCTDASHVDNNRSDAWACTAEGTRYDPCFANPDRSEVACPDLPAARGATASGGFMLSVVVVRPARPLLSADENVPGSSPTPFLIELMDGQFCTFEPEDVRFNGLELFGYCTAGYWVGPPDLSKPLWNLPILQGGSSRSLYTIRSIDVKRIWF